MQFVKITDPQQIQRGKRVRDTKTNEESIIGGIIDGKFELVLPHRNTRVMDGIAFVASTQLLIDKFEIEA